MENFSTGYQELTNRELMIIDQIKSAAEKLSKLFTISNREMSIALTNLEQSVMWATKGICIDYISRVEEQKKNEMTYERHI